MVSLDEKDNKYEIIAKQLIVFLIILLFPFSCMERRDSNSHNKSITKTIYIVVPNNLQYYYPSSPNDTIMVKHQFYHLSYNDDLEQPNWVIYKLTKQMLNNSSVNRSNNFRKDSSVSFGSAIKEDYAGSGYDRGHLVPAADMKFSEDAMSETFYLSNMSPQIPDFNRGIWKRLEGKVRNWAIKNDSIIVIAGPIADSCIDWIGEDSICVPYQYFKVILDISLPRYKGIAFVMRNDNLSKSVFNYSITIDSVESITGFDFFSNIDITNIDSLESTKNDTLWR